MYYSIRHVTRFKYSAPVYESVMELRMHPRTEGLQRCYSFELAVQPRARVYSYRDPLGNTVHYFNIPENHRELAITAEALVQVDPEPVPERLDEAAWQGLDPELLPADAFEMLLPSRFAHPTLLLGELSKKVGAERRGDPLSLLRELNESVYHAFEYRPKATKVDSPIDEALASKKGVCQDFAHIFTALLRGLMIPARYVSGYLYHTSEYPDRSSEGATHAWVEAWLPGPGWVGFDPTNNLLPHERHIRTAVGRDYGDVPPTRGVFKGEAGGKLTVSVAVSPSDVLPPERDLIPEPISEQDVVPRGSDREKEQQQQ